MPNEPWFGPLIGLALAAAIFIPLERLFPQYPDQRIFRDGWQNDLLHFLLTHLLTKAIIWVAVVVVVLSLRPQLPLAFQAQIRSQPLWLQFVEAVVLAEFLGYWAHRAAHHIPFLWRLHAIHHSPTELDWLAAARLHPLDQGIHRLCIFIPVYCIGFSEAVFGSFTVFFTFLAIFAHANTRLTFGPLKYVMITPEYHRWHHSKAPEAANKNFGGLLPVFDWVFGTLYLPAHKHPGDFGIETPIANHYWQQLFHPFRRLETTALHGE